ncbi:MAG: GNAT family N-acetyltransferase [Gemmatimonadota bacterium]|nr:GNAT family N-acetyltransferase [Gemmatimonadota bacterium]
MIRLLQEADAQAYIDLRRQALLEAPLAFTASPEDDVAASVEAVREQLRQTPQSVIIGAFQDGLVGIVGLYRDRHAKASHKSHLWGMYVTPDHRQQGLGSQLLEAALRHARTLAGITWVHLGVSSAASEARRLYDRAGFRVWGAEPDALRHADQAVVEYHMALQLESADS